MKVYSDEVQRQLSPFRPRSFLITLRNILQLVPFRPIDVNCLYLLEYSGIPPSCAAFSRSCCEVRSATLGDLQGITKCQSTPEIALRRFQSYENCVVATVDGRIVGFEWFCAKPSHSEERYSYKVEIPSDTIYAYDAFILPEHRLSGVWLKFKTVYLRELMQTLQRRRIITMVDRGNRISMSTHLRFGFKLVRKVFVLKVLGKSFFLERKLDNQRLALAASFPKMMKRDETEEARFSKSVANWIRQKESYACHETTAANCHGNSDR